MPTIRKSPRAGWVLLPVSSLAWRVRSYQEWQEQTARRMRLAGMRFPSRLLFLILFMLAAGCSVPRENSNVAPAPEAAPGPYQPGSPVETTADAVSVAGTLFEEKGGIQWIEPPQAVFAEEMSYAQAQGRLGVGEGQYDTWPPETRVWLVIFKGRWQLTPLDPSQAAPTPLDYEGCGFTLFTAGDGEWMAMGDAVCPGS